MREATRNAFNTVNYGLTSDHRRGGIDSGNRVKEKMRWNVKPNGWARITCVHRIETEMFCYVHTFSVHSFRSDKQFSCLHLSVFSLRLVRLHHVCANMFEIRRPAYARKKLVLLDRSHRVTIPYYKNIYRVEWRVISYSADRRLWNSITLVVLIESDNDCLWFLFCSNLSLNSFRLNITENVTSFTIIRILSLRYFDSAT